MNKSLQSLKRKPALKLPLLKNGKSTQTPANLDQDTPDTAATPVQSNTTLSVEHDGMPSLPLENVDDDSIAGLSSVDDNEECSRHDSVDDDSYYRQDDYFAMAQSVSKSHTERSISENEDVDRSIISMTSTHSIDVGNVDILDWNLEPKKDYRSHFQQLMMSSGHDASDDTARPVTPSLSALDLAQIQPKTPDVASRARLEDHLDSMSPESQLRTVRASISELMALGPSFDEIYASSPTCDTADSAEHTADTDKILSDNKKLGKVKMNLLKQLGSTAKQFSVYEKMTVQRIHDLEEKNRLLAGPDGVDPKLVGPEAVQRLSGNARDLESNLKEKELQITQRSVKCEALNKTISEYSEERHDQGALADVSTLTAKLENSNQALDASLNEVKELKQWKTKHLTQVLKYREDSAKSLEVEKEKLKKEYEIKLEEKAKESRIIEEKRAIERLAAEEQVNAEQTLEIERLREAHAAAEVCVESLRSDVAARDVEATQLQKDLERSLNEIEDLKRSIDEAGAAKGYADFQLVVEEWKDKAVMSEKKAVELRELVAQLTEQLDSKNGEVEKLRSATEAQNAEIEKLRVMTEIACRKSEGARQTNANTAPEPIGSKAQESSILNIANSLSEDGGENTVSSPSNTRQVLSRLKNVRDMINVKIESRRGAAVDVDEGDLENRIRLRDRKISSQQKIINSSTKMVSF